MASLLTPCRLSKYGDHRFVQFYDVRILERDCVCVCVCVCSWSLIDLIGKKGWVLIETVAETTIYPQLL